MYHVGVQLHSKYKQSEHKMDNTQPSEYWREHCQRC